MTTRVFTPVQLAAALTRRGNPTSAQQARRILAGLELQHVVERVNGDGAFVLTPRGLVAARSWAAVGEHMEGAA